MTDIIQSVLVKKIVKNGYLTEKKPLQKKR